LRTFLRTRWAALEVGAFAMSYFRLFLQSRSAFARTFAGACIGASALAAHRQATAMTEAAVAADVHQALDVHRGFAAQVTLDGVQADLIANLFKIAVSQILDLFAVSNPTSLADFASASATDAENSRQADFGMLMRRNIDTSDTSHSVLYLLFKSTLALLVARIGTNDPHDTLAADDLAVAANFLD
jgi:hypothetical protein